MSKQTVDVRKFADLLELRDFLNTHSESMLRTTFPESGDHFVYTLIEKTLSDGSTVFNADITTPDISMDELQRQLGRAA